MSEASTEVDVEGNVLGATVQVWIQRAGELLLGGQVDAAPWSRTRVPLDVPLLAGDQLTAVQKIGGDASAMGGGPPVTVIPLPAAPPPAPALRFPPYAGARSLNVEGAFPGASVEVLAGGVPIGSVKTAHGRETLDVGLNEAGSLAVRSEVPGTSTTLAACPDAKLPPTLDPPVVHDLVAGQRAVRVSGLVPGAEVLVSVNGGPASAFPSAGLETVVVLAPLSKGDEVTFQQSMAGREPSPPLTRTVGDLDLQPPGLGRLFAGADLVFLHGLQPGADVIVESIVDGVPTRVGHGSSAEGTMTLCVAPLVEGATVIARQELGGHVSPTLAEAVVAPTPTLEPPVFEVSPIADAFEIVVAGLVPGARIEVVSAMFGQLRVLGARAPRERISVPKLVAGDTISVRQSIGASVSEPLVGTVLEVAELPAPAVIRTPEDGRAVVRIGSALPGAVLQVFDGDRCLASVVATEERFDLPLVAPLQRDRTLTVRQYLGDRIATDGIRYRVGPQTPFVVENWDIGILAVHAAALYTGEVLLFGGSEHDADEWLAASGGSDAIVNPSPVDKTRLWNPRTNTLSVVGSPPHDLFCCGHTMLEDGRVLVAGGTSFYPETVEDTGYAYYDIPEDKANHAQRAGHFGGLRETQTFDPSSRGWLPSGLMSNYGIERGGGRWYPGLVTLGDGRVMMTGGHPDYGETRHSNYGIEIWDRSTEAWTPVSDLPSGKRREINYPRMFLLPNGKVFSYTSLDSTDYSDANAYCWEFDPVTGSGALLPVFAPSGYDGFMHAATILPLRPPTYTVTVLLSGSGIGPRKLDVYPTMGEAWTEAGVMSVPERSAGMLVLLPDETAITFGGSDIGDPTCVIDQLTPELYDPVANTWTPLSPTTIPRTYHSTCLLLEDGRIMLAGSQHGCGRNGPGPVPPTYRRNDASDTRGKVLETFSPPYLYRGVRPQITTAPNEVVHGATFVVDTTVPVARACVMRLGTSTHAFDGDQRCVVLTIAGQMPGSVTLVAPPNAYVAPPGYYWLFVLDASGVPSIGWPIRFRPGEGMEAHPS